ncbi:glycosyltransferase family 4 protein [Cochlodiniinecator piscidefendens]|uniref:glycosyltransferase family 4 protein n=1 Tax=Cochlodiniinecator piscidefendens TaxID=2715756 RepID=UPI00140E1B8E|nr:glycosyltransferase family 4 protein [Cochlodiniinecator piscidefendens]
MTDHKIAYLTGEYPRATDTFIQREVAGLRATGLTVETCSIRETSLEHLVGEEQKSEATRTFHVLKAALSPLTLLRSHLSNMRRNPRRCFSAFALALKTRQPGMKGLLYQMVYLAEASVLARHMHRKGITHLHNHIAMASGTVAMLASEISGIPYSFTLHGPDIFYEAHRWRLDEKLKRAQFVACISHFARSQAMSFASSENWSKFHIVHCGVDPDRYQNTRERSGQNLLFVGRLAAVKGLPVLFEALDQLRPTHPDLTVTLIGDGAERTALEKTAPSNVKFVGYKSQSEVAQALEAHDMLILPSFAEGLPVVLMEALASEMPVVATRIAGVSELVDDAMLVAPGDAQQLAQRIKDLLHNPVHATALAKQGRAKVLKDFDAAKEAKWLSQIIIDHHNHKTPGLRPEDK